MTTRPIIQLYTRIVFALVCGAVFWGTPAHADIAGGGTLYYDSTEVRFENLNAYRKEYRFYVTGQGGKLYYPVSKDGTYDGHDLPHQVKELRLCAIPQSLPMKKDGQPYDTYFTRPTNGVLFSNPFELEREPHRGRPMVITWHYKVLIQPVAPAVKGKPVQKKLVLALSKREMSSVGGYLLGVPVLAALGLIVRRSRSNTR